VASHRESAHLAEAAGGQIDLHDAASVRSCAGEPASAEPVRPALGIAIIAELTRDKPGRTWICLKEALPATT
jgi:hypothetical protein